MSQSYKWAIQHTYKWVMSHIQMSHVTHIIFFFVWVKERTHNPLDNQIWITAYELIIKIQRCSLWAHTTSSHYVTQMRTSHVTDMNEPHHRYGWVMIIYECYELAQWYTPGIWMSHELIWMSHDFIWMLRTHINEARTDMNDSRTHMDESRSYMNVTDSHNSTHPDPLTEEIRLNMFWSPHLSVFLVDILSVRDSVYSRENLFEILGTPMKMCLICTGTPVKNLLDILAIVIILSPISSVCGNLLISSL